MTAKRPGSDDGEPDRQSGAGDEDAIGQTYRGCCSSPASPRPVCAEKAAAEDSRSVASYVEKLATEHLRSGGYLKAEKAA